MKKHIEWIEICPGVKVRRDEYDAMLQVAADKKRRAAEKHKQDAAADRQRLARLSGGEVNPRKHYRREGIRYSE